MNKKKEFGSLEEFTSEAKENEMFTEGVLEQENFNSIEEFFSHFRRGDEKGKLYFADTLQTGEASPYRTRFAFSKRDVIYNSINGFVPPEPSKEIYTFQVSDERLNDFGVLYIVSDRRRVNPDVPGEIVAVDKIEDEEEGKFYHTIIYEKNKRPPAVQPRDWH